MPKNKILSFLLSLTLIASCFPTNVVFAQNSKRERKVYIHAQGINPSKTEEVSTIYSDETADIYLAVDKPNMGDVENGVHTEPKYDMNGYTATIYFDPTYFEVAKTVNPIIYTVPEADFSTSGKKDEEVGDETIEVPSGEGYYPRVNKVGERTIDGKKYGYATVTVFFNGKYLPSKDVYWYNLCKLPLKPLRAGSTQVFLDLSNDEVLGLKLFAKNDSEELSEQTFNYYAEKSGYHDIVIKNRGIPYAPTANYQSGKYTDEIKVKLTAESGCRIYYAVGDEPMQLYDGGEIPVSSNTSISCYAERDGEGNNTLKSNTVKYEYEFVPKPPYLFTASKQLIPNKYRENDEFTVLVSDKSIFGDIEPGSDIYYTFSDISEENPTDGENPETEWVKVSKPSQSIEIKKNVTIRLITKKLDKLSEVSEYRLGIKPPAPYSETQSGDYSGKLDIELKCDNEKAEIYYTVDGGNPAENGILYSGKIPISKSATVRAVAKLDGIYSDTVSYYYRITQADEYAVEAYLPPGTYEGSTSVTLTSQKSVIKYSIDGGDWKTYDKPITVDRDMQIKAKSGDGTDFGEEYIFSYRILPYAPCFSPESTSFSKESNISIYSLESYADTAADFELYYTTDGKDPIRYGTKSGDILNSVKLDIKKNQTIKAVVKKVGGNYSRVVTHSYEINPQKPAKPIATLAEGNYTAKINSAEKLETLFDTVTNDTEIYYNVSYDGSFKENPSPQNGIKYNNDTPIEIKGHTFIKAVAVNVFGVMSDVAVYEYIVTPEAPKAAPSATIAQHTLVPIKAAEGSTVKYTVNSFTNEVLCENGEIYIDTESGNAYGDRNRTSQLGAVSQETMASPVKLSVKTVLADGLESAENKYTYEIKSSAPPAPPYADMVSGEYYEQKSAENDDTLLYVKLYSLNNGDKIQYKTGDVWIDYNGEAVAVNGDTELALRSVKDNMGESAAANYVYNFVPLPPVIKKASGRYSADVNAETEIDYNDNVPERLKGDYEILYRINGELVNGVHKDNLYLGQKRSINTMSMKAFVRNTKNGKISKNAVNYYIAEPTEITFGKVYVVGVYNTSEIDASLLGEGEYAEGIKLETYNKNAEIHYNYSYKLKNGTVGKSVDDLKYSDTPIMVNPQMTEISINMWLTDGVSEIANSRSTHKITFIHSSQTGGGNGGGTSVIDKTKKYTKDIFGTEYPTHISYINGYPDGSVKPEGKMTREEITAVLYRITSHEYEKPFVTSGNVFSDIKSDRWSAHDIEYMAEKGVVTGYPDGEFKPENNLTRAEFAALISRFAKLIANGKDNEFSDLPGEHWAYDDILALAESGLINGYGDGTFRAEEDITRAEVMTVINKLLGRKPSEKYLKTLDFNPYTDIDKNKWHYADVLEATVTHTYDLDKNGIEIKWEDCK